MLDVGARAVYAVDAAPSPGLRASIACDGTVTPHTPRAPFTSWSSTVECIDVAHIKVREAGSLSKSGNCHVAVFGLNGGKAILREGVVLIVHYGVKVIGYPLGGGQHLADGIKVWLVA